MKKIILFLLFPFCLSAFEVVERFPAINAGDSYIALSVITPINRISDREIMSITRENFPTLEIVSFRSSDFLSFNSFIFEGDLYSQIFVYAENKNQFSYYILMKGHCSEGVKEFSKLLKVAVEKNWKTN